MTTGVERVFKKTQGGFYQEVFQHWIYYLREDGSRSRTKLDKTWLGKIYKKAEPRDKGHYGTATYTDPDDGVTYTLVALPPR